ncbi:MAG: hypothetical protein AAFV38_14805 [Pseudomonadota bacterium]
MSVGLQIAIAFGSIAVLLGLMAVVRHLAHVAGLNGEVQRKLVHVGTGLYAMGLPWLFPDRWPVYMLIGVTLIVMALLRLPAFARLGAAVHSVERRSYGDFLLAASVGLCFFLAEGTALYYILPIAVLTVADAAAALAGTTYGRRHFQVEDGQKSIEGSVVFFFIALLISIICFMFLSDLPPANILTLSVMVAAFGTLVEAQSWRGFDNLFLPLGLLIFLAIHSENSLLELAGLAAVFLAASVCFRLVGTRFGLTNHASRVYVVAMFLILAVTDMQNAVLPGLVLVAHAWANICNPSEDNYGELDIVASLALFSFGWLLLGNAIGANAVSFYGLTATGLVMGLSTIALKQRLLGVAIVGLALLALREVLMLFNPESSRWAEPLALVAVGCVVLSACATIVNARFFDKERVLKLTVLALLLPVASYLTMVVSGREELIMQVKLSS